MGNLKQKLSFALTIFMLVFGFAYAIYNFVIAIKGYVQLNKHFEEFCFCSNELSAHETPQTTFGLRFDSSAIFVCKCYTVHLTQRLAAI